MKVTIGIVTFYEKIRADTSNAKLVLRVRTQAEYHLYMDTVNTWKKCSTCKKPIPYNTNYYVCSVSTCNNPRTGYVFCSVPCFEVHLPGARHKDAAAIQERSPSRSVISTPPAQPAAGATPTKSTTAPTREVLVIASRMKDFIQAKGDMNTSGSVMDVLSDHLRVVCERAIENARADGRKTVMDRDFQFLKK